MGLLAALVVGNLQANGQFYGPNAVARVNLAVFLLLADTLAHWADALVETASLADLAAATPFLPKTEALAPSVGRYRRQAALFVQRQPAAQAAIALVTAGTHLLLFCYVAALADQQEGRERGWVLQAVVELAGLFDRLSVPTHSWGLLLAFCYIMYRFLLLWVSLMDFLDGKS